MKRKFFMLALAGLVAFSFVGTSCGDDDDDDTPVNNNQQKPADENKDNTENKDNKDNNGGGTTTEEKNHYLVVKTQEIKDQPWDTQFWFAAPSPFAADQAWKLTMKVKAKDETTTGIKQLGGDLKEVDFNGISTQVHHGKAGDYKHWAAVGNVVFTTEWKEYTFEGTTTADYATGEEIGLVAFNLNDFNAANEYYFDDISFTIDGVEQITNGNFEGDDFSSFWVKEAPATDPVQAAASNIAEE